MSNTGATRTRFFASSARNASANRMNDNDTLSSSSSSSAVSSDAKLGSLSMALVPVTPENSRADVVQPAPDSFGDEIVAQRTRTTEIETLYQKKDKNTMLNVSGLLKRRNVGAKVTDDVAHRANIREIPDDGDETFIRLSRTLISPTKTSTLSSSDSIPHSNQFATSHGSACYFPALGTFEGTDSEAVHPYENNSDAATHRETEDRHSIKRGSVSPNKAPLRFATPKPLESRRVMRRQDERKDFNEVQTDGIVAESFQTTGCLGTAVQEQSYVAHGFHAQNGEKRVFDPEIEHLEAGRHAAKRARTENHSDRASNSDPSESRQIALPALATREETSPGDFAARPPLGFYLGQDLDEYISTHIDRYETAKKHWSECSRDEWEKGADELMERFTKILDFVKDHVKRKVALCASLHSKIEEHQRSREGVADMLKNVQNKLVAKTGIVIEGELMDSPK